MSTNDKPAIRYVVCPGVIPSSSGRMMYVSGPELMRLYRVDPTECYILEEGDEPSSAIHAEGMVFLFPNAHGNYKLPEGG